MIQLVPLVNGSANAHQEFSGQFGDNFLVITLGYLQVGQWWMNIDREGVRLVSGALLEPKCDIIQHWNLTGDIGRFTMIGKEPTLDNLGVDNQLYWISPDETF